MPSSAPEYLKTRELYLTKFLYNGMTAEDIDAYANIKFGDQTVHMGFALQTFADEAGILARAGLDPSPSERVVADLLAGFDELLGQAVIDKYGQPDDGFFVRDHVDDNHRHGIPAGLNIDSDFNPWKPLTDDAMSLDQVTHMLMGLREVVTSSTSQANITQARGQVDRVMGYLEHNHYLLSLPGGGAIPGGRGPDCRAASGFLSIMAGQATGQDYLGDWDNNTIRIDVPVRPIMDALDALTGGLADLVATAREAITGNGYGDYVPAFVPVSVIRQIIVDNDSMAEAALAGKVTLNNFLPSWLTHLSVSYPSISGPWYRPDVEWKTTTVGDLLDQSPSRWTSRRWRSTRPPVRSSWSRRLSTAASATRPSTTSR